MTDRSLTLSAPAKINLYLGVHTERDDRGYHRVDSLMAAAMVGEGTSYDQLTYTIELNSEEYGVGFRQGSDLVERLNQFFADSYADGAMMELAETYGVQAAIIPQA